MKRFQYNSSTSISIKSESIKGSSETSTNSLVLSDIESDSFIEIKDGTYDLEKIIDQDKSLINWEKWLESRKRQQSHIKKVLNIEADSLVMNSEDNYKHKDDIKLIEYANKYVKFDKYRGDPKFWEKPDYLTDRNKCDIPLTCSVEEKYERTKPNLNLLPDMDYTGIPKVIKEEKGLSIEKKVKLKYHKCQYYSDRKILLKDNIDLIEKHIPDLDNLCIKGEKIISEEELEETIKIKAIQPYVFDIPLICITNEEPCLVTSEESDEINDEHDCKKDCPRLQKCEHSTDIKKYIDYIIYKAKLSTLQILQSDVEENIEEQIERFIDEEIIIKAKQRVELKKIDENTKILFDNRLSPDIVLTESMKKKLGKNVFLQLKPELKINGRTINKFIARKLKDKNFNYVIQYSNCNPNKIYKEKLKVENISNVIIRYSWEKSNDHKNVLLPLRYTNILMKRFLFPTENNVFLPGQIIKIPFLFLSRESGVFTETWKLITDPDITNGKGIFINLQSFVRVDRSYITGLTNIEDFINQKKIENSAKSLVDEILLSHLPDITVLHSNLFNDEQVFLHNNPDYYYEHETLQMLYEFHKEITGENKWDYSIITLRNNILKKPLILEEKREYLDKLYKLILPLLKPTVTMKQYNEKYNCVYQILCMLCDTIDHEAHELKSTYRLIKPSNSIISLPRQTTSDIILESKQRKSINSKKSLSLSKSRQSTTSMNNSIKSLIEKPLKKNTRSNSLTSEEIDSTYEMRKCHYNETLFIKVYHHISTAIDEITAVIESVNLFTVQNK